MPHNFTRPTLPYSNVSLPNDNRFRVLTSVLNSPPTDLIIDTEYNYIIDGMNLLDQDIINVAAGNIPGSSTPANANHFLTTDGAGNLSFVLVSGANVQDVSLPGTKIINSSITELQIADGAMTSGKYAPLSIPEGALQNGAASRNKIPDLAINTEKLDNEAVTAAKTAKKTMTSAEIADNTITNNNILGPINVPKGGTGLNTFTIPYGLICAGTTPTGNLQNVGTGTLGQVFTSAGANSVGVWSTPTQSAVKNDQITGTATNLYINPAVQQFHKSSVKAWLFANGDGTILASYNIASVTVLLTGRYEIVMNTPMSTQYYSICCTAQATSSGNCFVTLANSITPTPTKFTIDCLKGNDTRITPETFSCQICGVQ